MASQMRQLNLDHAKGMKAKEVEIHFLHCTATDSSLETVNALLVKKELKGWTLSKSLPDWEKMSPEDVEEEIRDRGNQHKLVYDPENPQLLSRAKITLGAFWGKCGKKLKELLSQQNDLRDPLLPLYQ